ncbi:B-cell differentiation antigen CD72-like [Neopsephotus bourkii]|uniref:B-cell differentiation antigen CD72-like n=1 Tax=Neopsephotus bourkii TaxID=309878 RepID=UPI002AA58B38|nr:B-cell differentiation antigen CD72-like [Neopsephotus bourkii]
MAQSVVYADLKFAASVPSCPAAPDEDDSPYENVLLGTVPAEPSPGQSPATDMEILWAHLISSHLMSPLAGRCPRRWRVPMGPLAVSLLVLLVLLVVGTVALGTCYWQVTRSLRDASREHAAEQGRLEQELSAREQRLEQTRLELGRARAELGRAWRDGNSSRAALERQDMELGRARQELAELRRDVQRLQGELNSSQSTVASLRACVNTECCPSGWVLYRGKCLFISVESKTWKDSHQYCQRTSAQLLVQADWASWTAPVQSRGAAAPQGWGQCWGGQIQQQQRCRGAGWHRQIQDSRAPDGLWAWGRQLTASIPQLFMQGNGAVYWVGERYRGHLDSREDRSWVCPGISYGEMERFYCSRKLPWICEKLPDVRSTSKTVPPLPAKW